MQEKEVCHSSAVAVVRTGARFAWLVGVQNHAGVKRMGLEQHESLDMMRIDSSRPTTSVSATL